jgi:hypothetical protein
MHPQSVKAGRPTLIRSILPVYLSSSALPRDAHPTPNPAIPHAPNPQETREVTAKVHVGEASAGVALARAEQLTPLEDRIKSLHASMISVRDLQDQMREQASTVVWAQGRTGRGGWGRIGGRESS